MCRRTGASSRSACHYASEAGFGWLGRLGKMVFLGTPHHGAPLERGGNWVHVFTDLHAYSAPFSRLAKLRSAGITDLRHGSVLDEDWLGKDRFALAASIGKEQGTMGDGLVPQASALGQHADRARCLTLEQAVVVQANHMALLSSPEVYRVLTAWL